mmetsp:Transcript_26881/g.77494  ORF Transcript_26881/g.77494 Transcript_26881/m.77494 type:complete len:548 (+) Transcript_26881:171-1814(+)
MSTLRTSSSLGLLCVTALLLSFNLDHAEAFAIPAKHGAAGGVALSSLGSCRIKDERMVVTRMSSSSDDESSSSSSTATKSEAAEGSKKQTHSSAVPTIERDPDDEITSEKVFGAEFFGGTKVKEELFDPVAEDRAAELARQERDALQLDGGRTVYRRFEDTTCFVDGEAADVARRLQAAINGALYDEDEVVPMYATNFDWTTPFPRAKGSQTPLDELTNALSFYKRLDLAIVGGRSLPGSDGDSARNEMEFRWEVSVEWPNVWESRVLLTGTSRIVLDASSGKIVSQTDKLDGGDTVVAAIGSQLNPRFWDLYHIGMTPSAELSPRLQPRGDVKKGLFSGSYELCEVPPRLVIQPTLLDLGGRDERIAQVIPNHAFSTIIKTTGPNKQRYVPVSPIEVAISRDAEAGANRVTWSIPIAPEFLAAAGSDGELPLPAPDQDTSADAQAESGYKLQPRRLVATVPYGGNPQDEDVSNVRKELYDAIIKDGLNPKLDESGRPMFFFWQSDAKACYVSDGGLGMNVYEWRPKFANSNAVGIELERGSNLERR